MKSGIFLLCLGMLAPVQAVAIFKLIRCEMLTQSWQPKTEWVSVTCTAVLTFAMAALPITLAAIILTRGK